ncbi:hypothetical protein [Sphingomonas hylomeconis]|uniref:hypothetical protein n=1 Tax=Sphingomonas hylomeconis TaxID=1395958 RepID=UPI0021BA95B7|nr:hypothetical protein [Sphingomonas hylomeconis]
MNVDLPLTPGFTIIHRQIIVYPPALLGSLQIDFEYDATQLRIWPTRFPGCHARLLSITGPMEAPRGAPLGAAPLRPACTIVPRPHPL